MNRIRTAVATALLVSFVGFQPTPTFAQNRDRNDRAEQKWERREAQRERKEAQREWREDRRSEARYYAQRNNWDAARYYRQPAAPTAKVLNPEDLELMRRFQEMRDASDLILQFGPYKGNLSLDGTRMVVRARKADGRTIAFALDVETGQRHAEIDVDRIPGANGYCGISPSGQFIACFQNLPNGVDTAHIFTLEGREIQHWHEHHRPGHGDMAIDADNNDVYVGISKADPDKWHVIKRRLKDGQVTILAPAGYATHASTRNIQRPSWVFLSYEGSREKIGGQPGWAPFYQEVVALLRENRGKLDSLAAALLERDPPRCPDPKCQARL